MFGRNTDGHDCNIEFKLMIHRGFLLRFSPRTLVEKITKEKLPGIVVLDSDAPILFSAKHSTMDPKSSLRSKWSSIRCGSMIFRRAFLMKPGQNQVTMKIA